MEKGKKKNIRIGLFGGTFNPVHYGHLRSAEEIYASFHLARVIFIPAHIPPHKKPDVLSAQHRYTMVSLAIRNNASFQVSDIELKRPDKSYSIDTIRHFHGIDNSGGEVFFIMGTDAFREIHTWKEYPALFSTCNFIVMIRPGAGTDRLAELLPKDARKEFKYKQDKHCFEHISGYGIHLFNGTQLNISSTAIRANVKQGRSIRYLVPSEVEHYIAEHSLYQH